MPRRMFALCSSSVSVDCTSPTGWKAYSRTLPRFMACSTCSITFPFFAGRSCSASISTIFSRLLWWSNTITTLYNIYSTSGASFSACVSSFTSMSSRYRTALNDVYPNSPHTLLSSPSTRMRSMSACMASAVVKSCVMSCCAVVPSGMCMVATPWPTATEAMGSMPMKLREWLWS